MYDTSPGRSTTGSNKHFEERFVLKNSTNQVQQLKEDSLRLYGKLKNHPDDSLMEAIRQYEQLTPIKRKSHTPKKRRR